MPRIFDLSELDVEEEATMSMAVRNQSLHVCDTVPPGPVTDMLPEVATMARSGSGKLIPLWTTMELAVTVSNVTLELLGGGRTHPDIILNSSLAKFSLNGTRVHIKFLSDGSMAAELILKALRAIDTRPSKATKFREIIPVAEHDSHQLMFSYNQTSGGSNFNLDLDSPNVILSVDYLLSISTFFTLPQPDPTPDTHHTSVHPKPLKTSATPTAVEPAMYYRFNVIKPKLTLLADPERHDSDAVHLTVEKISVAQQGALAMTICNMGMSLGNMSNRQDGVKFLDECTMTLAIDQRAPRGQQYMSIQAHATPLVIRVSYRDFLLITTIYGKAVDFSQTQIENSKTSGVSGAQEDIDESLAISLPSIREEEVTQSSQATRRKEYVRFSIPQAYAGCKKLMLRQFGSGFLLSA